MFRKSFTKFMFMCTMVLVLIAQPITSGGVALADDREPVLYDGTAPVIAQDNPGGETLIDAAEIMSTSVETITTTVGDTTFTKTTFEGAGDYITIPEIIDGMTFPGWLGLIDADAGGRGNFANEPSPDTIAFWLTASGFSNEYRDIAFDDPIAEISFVYTSSVPVSIQAYDEAGDIIATASGPSITLGAVGGDPTGAFDQFLPLGVAVDDNIIAKVRIVGFQNQTGIDDLTIARTTGGTDTFLKDVCAPLDDFLNSGVTNVVLQYGIMAIKALAAYALIHTGVGIPVSAALVASLSFEVLHNGAIGNTLDGVGALVHEIVEDPPDPNYTEIATLSSFQELAPLGDSELAQEGANWINCLSRQLVIMQALLTSYERFQGATIANDQAFIHIQAQAIQQFSELLAQNQIELAQSLQAYIDGLQTASEIAPEQMNELQEQIVAIGFTQEQLETLGIPSELVSILQQAISELDLSSPEPFQLAQEWVTILNEQVIPSLNEVPSRLVIPLDGVAPLCALTSIEAGPPMQLTVTTQDTGSGLRKIEVILAENLAITLPTLPIGTVEPMIIQAYRINDSLPFHMVLNVTDVAGNTAVYEYPTTNSPPTADGNGPYQTTEGTVVALNASHSSDPDGNIILYEWDLDNDGQYNDASGVAPSVIFAENGSFIVGLKVTDDFDESDTHQTVVIVLNSPPNVSQIVSQQGWVCIGDEFSVCADFVDAGTQDTHTAIWDWGDGSTSEGTVSETSGSGNVSGSHSYNYTGIYEVTLTVIDDDGGSDYSCFRYAIVYDPEGGFVTGGGWIDSPIGAYTADPTLTGKAAFGFVSKYKKGRTTPNGDIEFQFKVGELNFFSDSYNWLVIAGHKAVCEGVGSMDGQGNYGFMLSSIDEKLTPSTDDDLFRIKIWDKDSDNAVIYDSQIGADDDADPTTAIGGGSIVIHK